MFDYAHAYRLIKPYVTFDYGRRKRFTSGEKSAIRKAYAAYTSAKRAGATLKKIRRNPGESDRAYKRRIAEIKAGMGQSGSPLKAVEIKALSPNDKVELKGTAIHVTNKKTGRRSRYYKVDQYALALDTENELRRLYAVPLNDGYDTISYMHGRSRGAEEFVLSKWPDGTPDDSLFVTRTMEMLSKYDLPTWQYVLTAVVAYRGGARKSV